MQCLLGHRLPALCKLRVAPRCSLRCRLTSQFHNCHKLGLFLSMGHKRLDRSMCSKLPIHIVRCIDVSGSHNCHSPVNLLHLDCMPLHQYTPRARPICSLLGRLQWQFHSSHSFGWWFRLDCIPPSQCRRSIRSTDTRWCNFWNARRTAHTPLFR